MLCTKVYTSRENTVYKSTHLQRGFITRITHFLFYSVISKTTHRAIDVFSETAGVLS